MVSVRLRSLIPASGEGARSRKRGQCPLIYWPNRFESHGLEHVAGGAASLIVSLPVLIAWFAAQDKLVQGLSMSAVLYPHSAG